MKYLKTYNESLRDKMKPKSKDDIILALDNLKSIDDRFLKAIEYDYFEGVKYVIEKIPAILFYGNIRKTILNTLIRVNNKDIINYYLNNENIRKIFNDDIIFILEKYVLGKHQNEIKRFEKEFYEYLQDTKFFKAIDYETDLIKVGKNGEFIFSYYPIDNTLFYKKSYFEKFISNHSKVLLDLLIKYILQYEYKIKIDEIIDDIPTATAKLKEIKKVAI